MSDDEQPFNQSFFESEIRKQKYKQLLDYGRQAAENVETSSFIDNMNVFTELVIESNKLCEEGDPSDRCGQSGEIVLDAQVCIQIYTHTMFQLFRLNHLMIFIVFLFFLKRSSSWQII